MMKRLTILCLALIAHGAAHAGPTTPTLEKDVLPILRAHCFKCHGTDTPKAGLDLRTRATLLKGGRNGPGVVPGSLKDSPLWLNVSTDKMPAAGEKLSDEQKDVLRRWILGGAPGEGVAATVAAVRPDQATAPAVKLGVAETARRIDAAIEARLKEAKAVAGPPADDAEFLRRACLDLTGRIPTAERAAAFLDSKDADKRARLIDELLASPEYGQAFAGVWARVITAEEPAQKAGLEKWLAKEFNANRGWDLVVRDLVAATGTGPEAAFVLSNVENKVPQPAKLAGATARLFLGVQLQCAECHNHPFADFKQKDFWALAAFFGRTRVEQKTKPGGVEEADAPIKGARPGPVIAIPTAAGKAAGQVVRARYLLGDEPALAEAGPFRPALAAWLTAPDNPYFARAAVNRLWASFFGRGIVNPIDDMHDENPPTHPEVLTALADEFRAAGFDRKHLIRCICATQAYQRTSAHSKDEALYGRMAVKVMGPEALYDSLVLALGVKELRIVTGPAASSGRGGSKAGAGSARDQFIRFFNTRDPDAYATEFSHGIPQALSLMNDALFNRATPLVERLVKADPAPDKVVEGLFLALLSRRPTDAERKRLTDHVASRGDPAAGYADVTWVLMNTPEFVLVR